MYRAATRGLPNKLIGRQLEIAESTVKAHLTVVFSVPGVRNRTEAASCRMCLWSTFACRTKRVST